MKDHKLPEVEVEVATEVVRNIKIDKLMNTIINSSNKMVITHRRSNNIKTQEMVITTMKAMLEVEGKEAAIEAAEVVTEVATNIKIPLLTKKEKKLLI